MTVKKLIKELSKWPEQYEVEDAHERNVVSVGLSHTSCEKDSSKRRGTVWIQFEEGQVSGKMILVN